VTQAEGGDHPDSERGCSGLFHVCSCHLSLSSTPCPGCGPVVDTRDASGRFVSQAIVVAHTRTADPPPLPPPIA
jgi:hypothetical protein